MNFSSANGIIRLLSLFGLCAGIFFLVNSEDLLVYLHPRSIILVKISVVLLSVLSLYELKTVWRTADDPRLDWRSLLLLIPLFAVFWVQPTGLTSRSAVQKGLSTMALSARQADPAEVPQGGAGTFREEAYVEELNLDESDIDSFENPPLSTESIFDPDAISKIAKQESRDSSVLNVGGYAIIRTQSNTSIIDTLREDSLYTMLTRIYEHPRMYRGKVFAMTGFVTPDSIVGKNTFFLSRMMVSCCSADAMPIGFFCEYDLSASLEQNSWVAVTGRIILKDVKFPWNESAMTIPVLKAVEVQPAKKPRMEYVYPIMY